ncbi:MAG: enoyl-CoA hydratase [Candidatus Lokiarchaeota archaeon]|nr:enoyl-CoA hydratase [Candidatus Lokiarchaeota archaeon]
MAENVKTANYDSIEVGNSASVTKTVTESDVILFAGITGDFNPLHTNEEFAKTTQFGKRLVHGCFSSGLISRALGMKLPGPGALYVSQTSNFKKPVFIGDTLTAKVTVNEKFLKKGGKLKFLKLKTEVLNQSGVVVTDGEATMIVL